MRFNLRIEFWCWTIGRLRLSTFPPKVHSGPLLICILLVFNRSAFYFRIGQLYSSMILYLEIANSNFPLFFRSLSRDCNSIVLILYFWDFQLSRESWAWHAQFEFLKNSIWSKNHIFRVVRSPTSKYDQLAQKMRGSMPPKFEVRDVLRTLEEAGLENKLPIYDDGRMIVEEGHMALKDVFSDSYMKNPLEMDWPFPLPSYSCSKIANNIGVDSNFQYIKV